MAMLVCVSLCVSVCVYMTIKCIFKAHKTSKWPFCCCSQRRKIVIFAVKKAFEKCARQWNSLHRRKRGREKESVVRRGERARRTRMPHYKCSSLSLSHLQYIKRHIYYIMEKQQSRGQTYTYTHAYICIRIREIQNQPSQACVRPTVWPKAEQTNQNRSEANRTTPNSDAGADDDADVAVAVAVASRRVVCIVAVKERCRCRCQGRTVPENGRVAWMNDSRTHTRTTAADGCRKKGANGDVSVSVAALCYCVGSKLS